MLHCGGKLRAGGSSSKSGNRSEGGHGEGVGARYGLSDRSIISSSVLPSLWDFDVFFAEEQPDGRSLVITEHGRGVKSGQKKNNLVLETPRLGCAFGSHVVAIAQVRKGWELAGLVARQRLLHEGAQAAPQLGGGRAEDVEYEQPFRGD